MNNWELAAKATNNSGLKIRVTHWGANGFIFFENGKWYDQCNEIYIPDFHMGSWQEYKEPKKMVTWYRPRVVWWRHDDKPEYVSWKFSKTKYSKDLVGSDTYKILEWQEITAPEKFEDIEDD